MRLLLHLAAVMALFSGFAHASSLEEVCKAQVMHKTGEGVMYQPGVDVYGRSVVGAELNAGGDFLPDVVSIPVTIDFVERFPDLQLPAGAEMKADIMTLDVHRDGRVFFNGAELSQDLSALCSQAESRVSHGQNPKDPVVSAPELIEGSYID